MSGLSTWAGVTLLFLLALCGRASETPNVVFILADDLGIGDLKSYNAETRIRTPQMDKLASEGVRFNDMHSPSSVCTPTRYAFLTGRYCWRSAMKKGVLNGSSPALIEPERMTIAKILKTQGYHTAVIGKWHLGLGTAPKTDYSQPLNAGPLTAGFDFFFDIPASLDMEPYVWVRNDRAEKAPTETVAESKHQRQGGEGFWRRGLAAPGFKHVDVLPRIEQETVAYINERGALQKGAREKNATVTPFFLYVPLTSPHTPWLPTAEFAGKSAVGAYGDFTEQTDATLGAILGALEAQGLKENTIVVLTSDNGSHWPAEDITKWNHRSNHLYRGQKSDIHEAGHRVPFIVRWPEKIAAGTSSNQTACLTDFFATMTEITGTALPNDAAEDSFSLLPVFRDPVAGKTSRDTTVHHSGDGMFAIRAGDWKLIDGLGSGGFTAPKFVKAKAGEPTGQLYNLKDDPSEQKNLFAEKPDMAESLSQKLKALKDSGRSRNN